MNTIKIKNLFAGLVAVALLLLHFTAAATPPPIPGSTPVPYSTYSTGSTNGATTLSYAIIGALSSNNGTPVITAIDAVSDKAGSKVQFYTVTNYVAATYTNSTTTLPVVSGNISAGTIIIRHLLTDNYEKRTLTTSTGTTNLVVTVAPWEAVVPGDVIYYVVSAGAPSFTLKTNTFSVANTGYSLQLAAGYLVAGQKGMPLLGEVDGTTSATLQGMTARFEP